MSAYPWAYRCSKCDELVEVDDVTAHVNAHKAAADWDGHLGLERVDKDEDAGAGD